jgi:hypothetical protein
MGSPLGHGPFLTASAVTLSWFQGWSYYIRISPPLAVVQLYRNDPDPGIHGACGWLIRRWQERFSDPRVARYGQERLKEIDKALATGKVEEKRQWYINRKDKRWSLFRSRVNFDW